MKEIMLVNLESSNLETHVSHVKIAISVFNF